VSASLPIPYFFHLAPKIHYGPGVSDRVGSVLWELGARRVLVITDAGVLAAGVCDRILARLDEAGLAYSVHSDLETNPSDVDVEGAAAQYRAHGADAVLGVGGGSSMDVAKSAALVVSNGGPITDYEQGRRPVTHAPPPLVLVPTTAGTGSELVAGAIITDSARVLKLLVVAVPAHVALCDPLLTLTLPPLPTGAAALDALAHAIGAYTSVERQPLADAMALYAISTISRWLPEVMRDGSDENARHQLMVGSMTAGISMKGGGSADHAFAHAVNAMFGVLHGVGVALFMPEVMEFNLPHMPERLAEVAVALGVPDLGGDGDEAAFGGIEVVRSLIQACAIPSLRDLGVRAEHVPELTGKVMADSLHLELNAMEITAPHAQDILTQAIARERAVR